MIKYFIQISLAGRNIKNCVKHPCKLGALFDFSKILKEVLLQAIMSNLNLLNAS